MAPAFSYDIHPIVCVHREALCVGDSVVLHGSVLSTLLAQAVEMAIVVCTIGPRLEEKVANYFAQNEPLRGLLLDYIGIAALDSLTTEICKSMKLVASSRGYQASSPLNPGMSGLPLSDQWQLFQLAPTENIDVCLTSSGVMVPQKSISMVIGIGPEMPTWTQAENCNRCLMKSSCAYRLYNEQCANPQCEQIEI